MVAGLHTPPSLGVSPAPLFFTNPADPKARANLTLKMSNVRRRVNLLHNNPALHARFDNGYKAWSQELYPVWVGLIASRGAFSGGIRGVDRAKQYLYQAHNASKKFSKS